MRISYSRQAAAARFFLTRGKCRPVNPRRVQRAGKRVTPRALDMQAKLVLATSRCRLTYEKTAPGGFFFNAFRAAFRKLLIDSRLASSNSREGLPSPAGSNSGILHVAFSQAVVLFSIARALGLATPLPPLFLGPPPKRGIISPLKSCSEIITAGRGTPSPMRKNANFQEAYQNTLPSLNAASSWAKDSV